MSINKTSLALRNGLTVPASHTAIERVTIDLRRDQMRVSFTTKVDDADADTLRALPPSSQNTSTRTVSGCST